MRLFLYCRTCRSKIFLESNAPTRLHLAQQWGEYFYIRCPHCGDHIQYHVHEVFAEKSSSNAIGGVILGGIIGALVGGPVGAITGSTIGGGVGVGSDESEYSKVRKFNNSWV